MGSLNNRKSAAGANDHLANERTFLAWIRTGIGIMGFGFVVVKFSKLIMMYFTLMQDQST
jgi:putative membrane protein